jgi:hypothetical protein
MYVLWSVQCSRPRSRATYSASRANHKPGSLIAGWSSLAFSALATASRIRAIVNGSRACVVYASPDAWSRVYYRYPSNNSFVASISCLHPPKVPAMRLWAGWRMRSGVPCFCVSFPCQTLIRRVPAKCMPQPHARAPHATPNRSRILDSGETRRARPLSANTSTQSPWLKSAAMMVVVVVVVCMQYMELSISAHRVIVERERRVEIGGAMRVPLQQYNTNVNCQSTVSRVCSCRKNACVRMSHTRRAPAVPAYLRAHGDAEPMIMYCVPCLHVVGDGTIYAASTILGLVACLHPPWKPGTLLNLHKSPSRLSGAAEVGERVDITRGVGFISEPN